MAVCKLEQTSINRVISFNKSKYFLRQSGIALWKI